MKDTINWEDIESSDLTKFPHHKKFSSKRRKPKRRDKRVKFTTMIKPALRDQLKHLAIEEKKSLADMIEEMIEHYIKKHDK